MNRFLITTMIALSFSGAAQAQDVGPWKPVSTTLFLLDNAESDDMKLGASLDSRINDVGISLFDFGHRICAEGQNIPVGEIAPFNVNGQLVKFSQGCINGVLIAQPTTEAGRRFLDQAVESGRPVSIDAGYRRPLHFPGTRLQPVREHLLAARSAM